MRIAVLGLSHESNTFSPVPATLEVFEQSGILDGDDIVTEYASSEATIGGYLAVTGSAPDAEVVPLLFTRITPMGPITPEAFETLCTRMLNALEEQGPWDGVLLALHGAAVAVEYPDADGEIARRVRDLVGNDVVIGVSHDMHANVSQQVVDEATVVVGYLTNPHVDARERALECGDLVIRTARGDITPTTAFQQLDVAISILRQSTLDEPMKSIMARAATVLDEAGVLNYSVWEGYPYADVEAMGMSCLVITDNDEALATSACKRIADDIWRHRDQFQGAAVAPEEAVTIVSDGGPVV